MAKNEEGEIRPPEHEEKREAENVEIPATETAPSKDHHEAEPTEVAKKNSSSYQAKNAPELLGEEEQTQKQIESGKSADIEEFATDNSINDSTKAVTIEDALYNTPFIPDEVFPNLPALLKDSCQRFDNKRERDSYLISALTVWSGCYKTVSGEYGQRTVYPNLYAFIVAPPASGKGVMPWGKHLGNTIHEKLIKENTELRRKYDLDLMAYRGLEKKAKKGEVDLSGHAMPIEPPFQVLFIPGDLSSTKLIDHLVDNGGGGIFSETEADTLAASFSTEWGRFSDKLRKAFHHEPISYSRVGGSRFKEVPCPRLSVLLTGTPSQVGGIVRNIADGLNSRFAFYTFKELPEWKAAFPKNKGNLTEYFNRLAKKVAGYAELLNKSNSRFRLTEQQEAKLDSICASWLKESAVLIGEDARASSIRLGLILYRIAMNLTALKKAESGISGEEMECCDTDFDTAVALCQVFKEHSYIMLKETQSHTNRKETKMMKFLRVLPDDRNFQRAEAVKAGIDLGIAERTVGSYLKDLVEGRLLEYPIPKDGIYKKVSRQTLQTLQSK